MGLFCNIDSLVTESDVEQKFIYPFLTSIFPMGLGLSPENIFTKSKLCQKPIGKGLSKKYYYPDYLIQIRGIPVLVIEAKKPNEDLYVAYSEARLYAAEVNAAHSHKVNVCEFVIVSNGEETWAGYSDHAEPKLKLSFDDFNVENASFVELLEFCAINKLEKLADKPYIDARGKAKFNTPVSQLGGKRVQNEELEENSFGRTFVLENGDIFDPETEEDRKAIVENAYIPSAKREQHIEPMYREIRKFEMPSIKNVTPLATDEPTELIQRMSQRIEEKVEAYSLMLLIGNVGSGKSTFIRYFKTIFLEKKFPDLASQCEWIFLNMNQAPVTKTEIYSWLKSEIIKKIEQNHLDIDFHHYEMIQKIFHKEIHNFENGIGQILKDNINAYNSELYKILKDRLEDKSLYLESLLIFLKENLDVLPIIVLDNCDKRNKDEQLLMFQVAQWLRTTYKCIVILPMRDSTYDYYRFEPPLDTVVKDLVFRIDPPDLLKVIQARLDYIMRITNQIDTTYVLMNGMNVSIKKTELIEYFKYILHAIRKNRLVCDIFYRLSDRNTRHGIELFEDFCRSGHILADDFFKIRAACETFELPSYKFLNAMLRKNRRYYKDEESNFVNIFHSDYNDDFPDPFVRVDILRWLKTNYIKEGPTKVKGMFRMFEVVRDMQIIGHKEIVVERELNYLVKRGLILSESLMNNVNKSDLIKITLPGLLHLMLLSNVSYLAACAEDVLFKNVTTMTMISRRLASSSYLSKLSIALTANEMVQYLYSYREEFCSNPGSYILNGEHTEIFDLFECKNSIAKWIEENKSISEEFTNLQKYRTGIRINVFVVIKNKGGVVCRFGENLSLKGFISVADHSYQLRYSDYETLNEDEELECEIIDYNYDHKSFGLKFIERKNKCTD